MTMEPLQLLFRFSQMARVLYRVTFRVCEEGQKTQVNANLFARWLMDESALCGDPELGIVTIGAAHKTHPLDVRRRKGENLLRGIAYQSQLPDAAPVRERDMSPIGGEFPACLLVFHASIIVLKPGIAFLARLLVLAVVVEPFDSEPGAGG